MAIRLRKIEGQTVALCAAETDPKDGDLYLDDEMHYALTVKFMRDFEKLSFFESVITLQKLAESQKIRDAQNEMKSYITTQEMIKGSAVRVKDSLFYSDSLHDYMKEECLFENELVVAVEFLDDRVFSLVTLYQGRTDSTDNLPMYFDSYDVDWSNLMGSYYYHLSGSGSDFQVTREYWIHPKFTEYFRVYGHEAKRLPKLPENFAETLKQMSEGATVYCSLCEDYLPLPEYPYDLCQHVWFCEECEDYSTPCRRSDESDRDGDFCPHERMDT